MLHQVAEAVTKEGPNKWPSFCQCVLNKVHLQVTHASWCRNGMQQGQSQAPQIKDTLGTIPQYCFQYYWNSQDAALTASRVASIATIFLHVWNMGPVI